MNIIFYDEEDTVTGRAVISGDNLSVYGSAALYAKGWIESGKTAQEFAQKYASWSNGYVRSLAVGDTVEAENNPETVESTLFFTISDDENEEVLELVKTEAGQMFIRENGDWSPVDPASEELETVYDQEWIDVSEDAIEFWDKIAGEDSSVSRDDALKYALDSE